jgi:hypothetical protein
MQAWAWACPSPSQAKPSVQGQAWDFSSPSPHNPSLAHHYLQSVCAYTGVVE